jgi:hypothetical protein
MTMTFTPMKTVVLAAGLALSASYAFAQGTVSGGSATGDPAASSGSAKGSTDTSGMSGSKSGSGTSTSGGRDDNGDQGRDKMPDSSVGVRPYDKQNKPAK